MPLTVGVGRRWSGICVSRGPGDPDGRGGRPYLQRRRCICAVWSVRGISRIQRDGHNGSVPFSLFLHRPCVSLMQCSEAGARVSGYMLDPNQLVPAAPGVQITASSQDRFNTIYEARNVGTLRRRAALPAPTGSCDVGKTTCPDLRGGTRCVDIRTDIFSESTFLPLRDAVRRFADDIQTVEVATLVPTRSKLASIAALCLTVMFSVSMDNVWRTPCRQCPREVICT